MNILAIGAHPDDIEIGCSGTLLRAAREGHELYFYVVTHGEVGGSPEQRMKELFIAATHMHVKKLWLDNFPDARLTTNAELIYHIEWIISKCNPNIIFTHSKSDVHHDHRAVAVSTIEAARRIPNILAYENPVTRRFNPQVYVDITDVIDDKLSLIRTFSSQNHRDYTAKEAIKGLAEYRALQSRNNQFVTHAEAFEVVKLSFSQDLALLRTPVITTLSKDLNYDISGIEDVPIKSKSNRAIAEEELK